MSFSPFRRSTFALLESHSPAQKGHCTFAHPWNFTLPVSEVPCSCIVSFSNQGSTNNPQLVQTSSFICRFRARELLPQLVEKDMNWIDVQVVRINDMAFTRYQNIDRPVIYRDLTIITVVNISTMITMMTKPRM